VKKNHGFFYFWGEKSFSIGQRKFGGFQSERTNQNAAFGEKGGANNGKDLSECSIWGEKFLDWVKEI